MNNNSYYVHGNSFPQSYYQPRPSRPGVPNRTTMSNNIGNPNDERFGFLGPFLLGGITGGLVAPFFYNGNQRPYYNNYYYYPPYYGPYYY